MRKFIKICTPIIFLTFPYLSQAHEVYVLNQSEIAHDMAQPALNLMAVAAADKFKFLLIAFLGIIAIICILGISLSRTIERTLDPVLLRIKPYAAHIAQVTLGVALLASAYYHALFGIELPFYQLFQNYSGVISIILTISGFSILLGIYARLSSLIILIIYLFTFFHIPGVYMLSYMTYFGEALVILLFGGGYKILELKSHFSLPVENFLNMLKKRKYFLLRIFFSISLIYAAAYAKLIHGSLALNTVMKYQLVNYFHFSPLFIVLGAFLIEIMVGIFYLVGFELRFTSLLFLTFLTMSLVFFGESVWPHIVLIGTAIVMFVHGYDEYTIERRWYKKGRREPVL